MFVSSQNIGHRQTRQTEANQTNSGKVYVEPKLERSRKRVSEQCNIFLPDIHPSQARVVTGFHCSNTVVGLIRLLAFNRTMHLVSYVINVDAVNLWYAQLEGRT